MDNRSQENVSAVPQSTLPQTALPTAENISTPQSELSSSIVIKPEPISYLMLPGLFFIASIVTCFTPVWPLSIGGFLLAGFFFLWLHSFTLLIQNGQLSYKTLFTHKPPILLSTVTKIDTSTGVTLNVRQQTSWYHLNLYDNNYYATNPLSINIKQFSKENLSILVQTIKNSNAAIQMSGFTQDIEQGNLNPMIKRGIGSMLIFLVLFYLISRIVPSIFIALNECKTNQQAHNLFCNNERSPIQKSTTKSNNTGLGAFLSPTVSRSTPSVAPLTHTPSVPTGWSTYSATADQFSILMPGVTKKSANNIAYPGTSESIPVSLYLGDFHVIPEQTQYEVTVTAFPSQFASALNPSTYFPRVIAAEQKKFAGSTIVSSQQGAYQSFPSADFILKIPAPNGAYYSINRLLLINTSAYSLTALSPVQNPPDYKSFVNSFQYLGH